MLVAKDAWDHLVRLDGSGLDMDWWRSVALIRAAATRLHPAIGVTPWKGSVAALFWDVGLPLLLHRRPYGVDDMGRLVHVPRERRVRHERALFGVDHQRLGREGMSCWGLHGLGPASKVQRDGVQVAPRAVALADLFQTLAHPEACLALGATSRAWLVTLVEIEACVQQARVWSADLQVPFVGTDTVLQRLRELPLRGDEER